MKIGLEIHVQLLTKSKLFCGCANRFVNEPNTLTCDYCLGMPGAKPRLNRAAVDVALKIGLALNCKFPKETFFSRKSYFYPDMGKNFQITQYEIPIAGNGHLKVGKKKYRIRRVQMEEDPARIVHVGTITQAEYLLMDYNRSGVPLCEIVTEPDFSDPKEARIFLQELSSILQYLNVFNPYIEGSMRVDANISVGSERVEVKNVSGFKEVERALNYEIVRQRGVVRRGVTVTRETRGWDAAAGVTRSLRTKEGEDDYGYIFEGDLPRITVAAKTVRELKKHLPEFAQQKVKRYMKMGIKEELADSIASDPDLAESFELVADAVSKNLAASWFSGEIKKTLNYHNLRLRDTRIKPEHIAKLLSLIEKKQITEKSAELILREMIEQPIDPDALLKEREVSRIGDEETIENLVNEVIESNPRAVADYKAGKQESFNFLVGQVMRKTQGRADQEVVREVLRRRLAD
jgi:aspartyl-tRNA(Asn)/glutamyl-tRNA(Gln) amidotransferase subunit B